MHDPKIDDADADAVNANGIKTLLNDGLSIFFIKRKPVSSNSPKSSTRNPPDCPILDNWVFENIILADEPFIKDLGILEFNVLGDNSLRGKLVSSLELPIIFDERFWVS